MVYSTFGFGILLIQKERYLKLHNCDFLHFKFTGENMYRMAPNNGSNPNAGVILLSTVNNNMLLFLTTLLVQHTGE